MTDPIKILDFVELNYYQKGDDAVCTCPWCNSDKLSVSYETPHQFQCYSCKHTGNAYTLLNNYYEDAALLKKSDGMYLQNLKPGTKAIMYRNLGVRLSPSGYVMPVHNQEGKIVALYKLNNTGIWYSSPNPTSLIVLGLHNLQSKGPIYICEGHWDYFAFIGSVDGNNINILGLCGSAFPKKLIRLLEGRKIIFLADNDEAGQSGVHRLAKNMKSTTQMPESLSYVDWDSILLPDGTVPRNKFDVRDLINSFT